MDIYWTLCNPWWHEATGLPVPVFLLWFPTLGGNYLKNPPVKVANEWVDSSPLENSLFNWVFLLLYTGGSLRSQSEYLYVFIYFELFISFYTLVCCSVITAIHQQSVLHIPLQGTCHRVPRKYLGMHACSPFKKQNSPQSAVWQERMSNRGNRIWPLIPREQCWKSDLNYNMIFKSPDPPHNGHSWSLAWYLSTRKRKQRC